MYQYKLGIMNPEYEEMCIRLESEQKYDHEQLETILKECCTKAVKIGELYYRDEKINMKGSLVECIDRDEIFTSGIRLMIKEKGFFPTKTEEARCYINPYGHCDWIKELEQATKEMIKRYNSVKE